MDGAIERPEIAQCDSPSAGCSRPRIVIVGAGFGSLSAAMRLGKATLDRRGQRKGINGLVW
jgi:hypothetical protein